MTGVLIKWGNLDTETCTQRKYIVKIGAEIEVMLLHHPFNKPPEPR